MRAIFTATLVAGLLGLAVLGPPALPAEDPPPPPLAADLPPEGSVVQARGQVHEAYGEPTQTQALQGVLVSKAVPNPIEEAPPEQKPAGDNVAWIPGYWGWDDEGKDFVWVSGFWRVVPPGQTWVPGHWVKSGDGFRFVSGYWVANVAATENHEVEYLPQPPALIEAGPSVPAAVTTDTYVPGLWVYQTNRYLWRPGYWVGYNPDWVWVPARYRWSPAGFIFVRGYWDRPLLRRGLLFAPVRFTRPIYLDAGFVYRPAFVIQPDFLCGAMFVRTDRSAYYFGDYFTPAYQRRYIAWDTYRPNRFTIDVNFGYYRHAYAGNPAWERSLRTLYTSRYNGDVPRPPRTLVQQNTVINNITINKTSNTFVNKTINITNVQNQTVLAPARSISNVRVTAMASLAGPGGAGARALPPVHEIRVEKATKANIVQERQAVTRIQAISKQRATNEVRLTPKTPVAVGQPPQRARIELPKGTPPARIIAAPKNVPVAPRAEIRQPPPPKKVDPIKPKGTVSATPAPEIIRSAPPATKPAPPPPAIVVAPKPTPPPAVAAKPTPPPTVKPTPPPPPPKTVAPPPAPAPKPTPPPPPAPKTPPGKPS